MLQLWACLNLCGTGSVCLGVQVLHMLESNCTYAALYKHWNRLYVACSQIMEKSIFSLLFRLTSAEESTCIILFVLLRFTGCVCAHSHFRSSVIFLHVADTCASWKHMRHVRSFANSRKSFLSNDWCRAVLHCAPCVPWLRNSQCDQWKAHNYMLTPEHRTQCEPLNPISQLAVLHPAQCWL